MQATDTCVSPGFNAKMQKQLLSYNHTKRPNTFSCSLVFLNIKDKILKLLDPGQKEGAKVAER